MGFLNRFLGGEKWAKEAEKIAKGEKKEAEKEAEGLKTSKIKAGEEKRGGEIMDSLTQGALKESKEAPYEKIWKAYQESLTGEGKQKEQEMFKNFSFEITSPYTAKAKDRITDTGHFLEKNLKKFGGAAETGLTFTKETGKAAMDLTKRGVGGALRGIKETGLNVAEFAQLRVAKPAKEIYGRYSDEVSKSLGIGAGVLETKSLAVQEWVKVNAARERDQGVEAYHKLRGGVSEIATSSQQRIKDWFDPEKRALARAEKRMMKAKEAAEKTGEKYAKDIEDAMQARQDFKVLKETFEQAI